MLVTSEYLKIFLLTSAITIGATSLAFSAGQFDTTKLDYRLDVHIEYLLSTNVSNTGHIWYEIYNTGSSDINTIVITCQNCRLASPALESPLTILCISCTPPRTANDLLSSSQSIKQDGTINLGNLERGDYVILHFDVTDTQGTNKLVIEQVLIR